MFALGIGAGVSTSLVKGVVRAGNGVAEFIADDARIQPKVRFALYICILILSMNSDCLYKPKAFNAITLEQQVKNRSM